MLRVASHDTDCHYRPTFAHVIVYIFLLISIRVNP